MVTRLCWQILLSRPERLQAAKLAVAGGRKRPVGPRSRVVTEDFATRIAAEQRLEELRAEHGESLAACLVDLPARRHAEQLNFADTALALPVQMRPPPPWSARR